jgi:uncharacterized protein (DUF2141 family)
MKSKLILIIILAGLVQYPLMGQGKLTVEVKNVKNADGIIHISLFRTEEDFLKKAFISQNTQADAKGVFFSFENLPAASYAISVIHDENENGELDKNLMGIPKEGFGFGNDAMGMFGPPTFDRAKIEFAGNDRTVAITLKYY